MAETFLNLIDGRWVPSKSGKTFENRNPANQEDLVGIFHGKFGIGHCHDKQSGHFRTNHASPLGHGS